MAGLLDMFGQGESPFAQWFEPRRNTITDGFAGMVGSGNDPRQALTGWTKGMLHGRDVDTENALIAKQEQEQQAAQQAETAKQNQTLEWLRTNAPEYADAVANGAMTAGDAWNATLKGQAAPEAVKPIEVNGQLVNPMTGEVVGDYRTPEVPKAAAPPTGYRFGADGQALEFIPGGPADPASAAANKGDTEQSRRAKQLATVVNPQLGIALTNFDALADTGNQAWNGVEVAGSRPFAGMTTPQFQQARNAVQTIAQSYLYSVSGAAAPTEEVNKLVESVTPKPFESPQSVADKKARLQSMVDAINLMATGGSAPAGGGGGWTVLGVE